MNGNYKQQIVNMLQGMPGAPRPPMNKIQPPPAQMPRPPMAQPPMAQPPMARPPQNYQPGPMPPKPPAKRVY